MLSIQTAKETTIYYAQSCNEVYTQRGMGTNAQNQVVFWHNENQKEGLTNIKQFQSELVSCQYKVESDLLYNFIMASERQVCSPRGVEGELFIEDRECEDEETSETYMEYDVCHWTGNGRSTKLTTFDNKEDAEQFKFDRVYEFDFLTEINRNTRYYACEEDCEDEIIELYQDMMNISRETAASYYNHQKKATQLRADRERKAAHEAEIRIAKYNARVEKIAAEYAQLIEKVEGENYKQTAARLSQTIGEKIESAVFHRAVKIIRSR